MNHSVVLLLKKLVVAFPVETVIGQEWCFADNLQSRYCL